MDLSKKVYQNESGPGGYANQPPPPLPPRQRPYLQPGPPLAPNQFPISSSSFIHSTPNHQYSPHPGHYFLSQGHEDARYNPMYGPPSPLFLINPNKPLPASSYDEDGQNYASELLDGMQPEEYYRQQRNGIGIKILITSD